MLYEKHPHPHTIHFQDLGSISNDLYYLHDNSSDMKETWTPNQSETFSNRTSVHDKSDDKLFVIEHYQDDLTERKKINNLIVNAPELLEALQDACECLEIFASKQGSQTQSASLKCDAEDFGSLRILDAARNAINKALNI